MLSPTLFSVVSALVVLTGSVAALPRPSQEAAPYTPAHDLSKLAKLFPQSALPSPTADLELKYVALGVGTQNYTCGSNKTAAPGTTGALGK